MREWEEWWLDYSRFFKRFYQLLMDCYEHSGDPEGIFTMIREEDEDKKYITDEELCPAER